MKLSLNKLKSGVMAGLLTVAFLSTGGVSTASAQHLDGSEQHDKNVSECVDQGIAWATFAAALGFSLVTVSAVQNEVFYNCMELREGLVAENQLPVWETVPLHLKKVNLFI